jgi:hypothetical protein
MATTKARPASPVHGAEVTTIHTGRITQRSGAGFGLSRLGGLINARVDGLTTDTASTRLATPAHDVQVHPEVQKLQGEIAKKEEQVRVKQADEFKETRKAAYEQEQKDKEAAKKLAEQLAKQKKPVPDVKPVEIVDGRVTAKDNVDPAKLDDPKAVANATKKTAEQQKADAAASAPSEQAPTQEKPRADVKPEDELKKAEEAKKKAEAEKK